MQITGGLFRKVHLQSLPSEKVRPTARRVREKLFELLAERIEGARFIDLCAGSGAVGIEALSRGAAHVTFVDCSTVACTYVRLNLEACGIGPGHRAAISVNKAFHFLQEAAARGDSRWSIAYFDPPYATDYTPVINLFTAGNLLYPNGLLVVEHHCKKQPEAGGALDYIGTAELGETCISFFEQKT